ncbi:hypothetical protein [Bradyrhizobium zhanjiangense]|uniref:hypothetical protein n=1 Tax=Bradyrhizobium zhanjiangense TaxID=1325107 RepID=UPI0013E8A7B6|nr:hypothetical protein [Bradyrhizobium zhanjiangense]
MAKDIALAKISPAATRMVLSSRLIPLFRRGFSPATKTVLSPNDPSLDGGPSPLQRLFGATPQLCPTGSAAPHQLSASALAMAVLTRVSVGATADGKTSAM